MNILEAPPTRKCFEPGWLGEGRIEQSSLLVGRVILHNIKLSGTIVM